MSDAHVENVRSMFHLIKQVGVKDVHLEYLKNKLNQLNFNIQFGSCNKQRSLIICNLHKIETKRSRERESKVGCEPP